VNLFPSVFNKFNFPEFAQKCYCILFVFSLNTDKYRYPLAGVPVFTPIFLVVLMNTTA